MNIVSRLATDSSPRVSYGAANLWLRGVRESRDDERFEGMNEVDRRLAQRIEERTDRQTHLLPSRWRPHRTQQSTPCNVRNRKAGCIKPQDYAQHRQSRFIPSLASFLDSLTQPRHALSLTS